MSTPELYYRVDSQTLHTALSVLKSLVESCDHSVGICWCMEQEVVEELAALIENRQCWWEEA